MDQQTANLSDFVTIDHLAEQLGVKKTSLLQMCYAGAPNIRVPGTRARIFHGPTLATWLLERQVRKVEDPEERGITDQEKGTENDV